MGSSKYNNIPMTVVDTRSRYVQKAVIENRPVSNSSDREIQLWPLVALLFDQLLHRFQQSLLIVKYHISQLVMRYPNIKKLPWLKISILALAAFVLLKKDMKFNVALNAPFSTVSDDQNDNYSAANVSAQTVAYRPNDSGKNAYAPVGVSDLRTQRTKDFIREYAPLAIEEMHKTGIPASIKIGQALIESRAGTSKLATNNNNFFGIKCFSKNCKKGHCTNATDDHHKDFFRKYTSAGGSWHHHSQILIQGRYKKLKKHGKDYKKWAVGLKNAGYATDKTYDKKLISVIEKYNLDRLDRR